MSILSNFLLKRWKKLKCSYRGRGHKSYAHACIYSVININTYPTRFLKKDGNLTCMHIEVEKYKPIHVIFKGVSWAKPLSKKLDEKVGKKVDIKVTKNSIIIIFLHYFSYLA